MDPITPEPLPIKSFATAEPAWDYVAEIYKRNTSFIREHLFALIRGEKPKGHVRATYPEVRVSSTSFQKIDSPSAARLGRRTGLQPLVSGPGVSTTGHRED